MIHQSTFSFTPGLAEVKDHAGRLVAIRMSTDQASGGDIVSTIQSVRGGGQAAAIAVEIYKRDSETLRLVGITNNAHHAVYYNRGMRSVLKCPIGPTGCDGLHTQELTSVPDLSALRDWVTELGADYWDWLHPRYRPAHS